MDLCAGKGVYHGNVIDIPFYRAPTVCVCYNRICLSCCVCVKCVPLIIVKNTTKNACIIRQYEMSCVSFGIAVSIFSEKQFKVLRMQQNCEFWLSLNSYSNG